LKIFCVITRLFEEKTNRSHFSSSGLQEAAD